MDDVDRLLADLRAGRPGAADALIAALYEVLHDTARRHLDGERADHTLQPTALVHEAWLRVGRQAERYANRETFLAAAATAIRRVLIDHARRRTAERRGGGALRVGFEGLALPDGVADGDVLAVDEVLAQLAGFAPDQARVVELRFFGGLTNPEIARVLEISETTVERRWRIARAWLRSRLDPSDGRE